MNELWSHYLDGHSVVYLRTKFPEATADTVWLPKLLSEGDWAVVSQDYFKKSDEEKRLMLRSGLTCFVLEPAWGKAKYWEKSIQMLKWWPKLVQQAELATAAFRVPWNTTSKLRQIV